MNDINLACDAKCFRELLIGRIKRIESPALLLTILVLLTMSDDEMKEFTEKLKIDNNN